VLAIEATEAYERGIRNISDYNRQNPGAVKEVIEWFRNYKVWEGKNINEFKWDGKILGVERSLEIIQESSQQYQ
jgi:inorganic pyrophosphatase